MFKLLTNAKIAQKVSIFKPNQSYNSFSLNSAVKMFHFQKFGSSSFFKDFGKEIFIC